MAILADHPLGLFWAYRFRQGQVATLFDDKLPANLNDGEGWIWAHFPLSDQRARGFLSQVHDAPDEVREILLGTEEAPRILFSGGWTYGILPDFEREFDGRVTGPGRLRFAFDDKRLITARRHPLQVADDMHNRLATGDAVFASPLEAFIAFNRLYYEVAEDHLDELADRMDSVEDKVLADTEDLERLELGPLRRDLSRRHREVSLLRTAYRRALSRQPHAHAYALSTHLPQLDQQGEDLDRSIVALQDRARLIHEDIDTKITSATNRTLRTLTIISVILMPPTLIVGAFALLRGLRILK